MATANNLQTLNGLFKEQYGDKLENIIPDGVKFLKSIRFVSKDKAQGSAYHQPVVLGLEHGVSFAATGDAFTLNSAIAGTTKDASVNGTQMVLRSVLSYTAASRALSGGAQAFESATKHLVGNMHRSMARKLEIELLYGQMGYGAVAAATAAPNTVTITDAEWASGIWSGAEGMIVEIRNAGGGTSRGEFTITSVDMDLKKLTLGSDPVAAGVVATDVLWHKGAYGNEFAGIHKILSNTGSLFGIDAAQYSLWKSSEYSAGGAALSFAKITAAVSKAVGKGLDQDVKVFVSPKTWDNLLSAEVAKRQYDGSYKPGEMENGAKSVKFHGQNGMIELEPSIFVKEGYAYVLVLEDFVRIGSTDITFKRPGQGDEFFKDLENAAGYELRAFCDEAVFSFAPGRQVLIKDIVNS